MACGPIIHAPVSNREGHLFFGQSNNNFPGLKSGFPTSPFNYQLPQPTTRWNYNTSTPSTVWGEVGPVGLSGGVHLSYAHQMVLAPKDVAIYQFGRAGTGLVSRWQPSANDLYPAAMEALAAAQALYSGTITWTVANFIGTEKDAENSTQSLQVGAALLALRDQLRIDLGNPNLIFVYTRLNVLNPSAFKDNVRAQADSVDGDDANTRMVDSDGFSLDPDNIHYDATGCVSLGDAHAAAALAP